MLWAVRAAWTISGLLWFLWLGYEDRSLMSVMLAAVAIIIAASLTIFYRSIWSRDVSGSRGVFWTTLLGLGAGLSAGPIAVLLITVKISLHAHPVPSFIMLDVVSILNRTIIWSIVGLLAGVALGWVYASKEG